MDGMKKQQQFMQVEGGSQKSRRLKWKPIPQAFLWLSDSGGVGLNFMEMC